MKLNKPYTALWILWLLAFAVIEGAALLDPGDGDTLTEHVRQWLSLSSRDRWAGRVVAVVLLFWLNMHFLWPKKETQKQEGRPVTTIAIMALLSTISNVVDNPLVKRLLKNLSEKTTNTVDDWVVAALYGATKLVPKPADAAVAADPAAVALTTVQEKYDEIKNAAETTGDYTELHKIKAPRAVRDSVDFDVRQ